MERTVHGYRFDDEKPSAVGVSSITYDAVREGAADVVIPVSIKMIDLSSALEDTGQRPMVDLLDTPPLQHACIVDVRDVIRMGSGRVGIVRELMDGPSLSMLFDQLGEQPLPPSAALFIARQCASALAFAHAKNLIHGDFCHRHVLLSSDGQVKVSDFQVASLLARASRAETRLRAGKHFFLAPEQLTAPRQSPLPETDVFALGVLIYRMICGFFPFADADVLLEGLAPDFHLSDEPWGPPLAKLLVECLSLQAELRPPAGEVERRLRRILGTNWPGFGTTELAGWLVELAAAPVAPAPPVEPLRGLSAPIGLATSELPPGPLRPPPDEERTGTDPEAGTGAPPSPLVPPPPERVYPTESTRVGRLPRLEPQLAARPPVPLQAPPPGPAAGADGGTARRQLLAMQDFVSRMPLLEQRIEALESFAAGMVRHQRPLATPGDDPALQELDERVANLEQTTAYLARELEVLRDRLDLFVSGLSKIVEGDHH